MCSHACACRLFSLQALHGPGDPFTANAKKVSTKGISAFKGRLSVRGTSPTGLRLDSRGCGTSG
jgi:hypothetical protein